MSPPLTKRKLVSLFESGRDMGEVFLLVGEVWIFYRVRLRTRLVSGARLEVMPYTSAEIPPAGAPSGFDSAAFHNFIS